MYKYLINIFIMGLHCINHYHNLDQYIPYFTEPKFRKSRVQTYIQVVKSGIVLVLKDTGFLIDAGFEIMVQLLKAGFKLSTTGFDPSKMPVPAPNRIPVQNGISLALTKCQPCS